MDVCIILLLVIGLFLQFLYSDGLLWIDKPDTFTYGPQGSNISIRWHYKMENKETFLNSEIRFKSRSLRLASRHTGENSYVAMELTGNTKVPFSVVGKTNVTLTVYNAEFSYVGEYCCEVKSNNLMPRVETCTSLYVYDPPKFTDNFRTRYNMTISSINITCRATGIPTPNVTWTEGDTREIISTKEYYEIPYVKCANKMLTFCCCANNGFGNIKSQPIQVQVMTEKIDCPETSKDISLGLPPNDSNSVPTMTTLGTTVILSMLLNTFLVLYIIWERRKEKIFFKKTKTQRSKDRNDEKLLTPNTKMIEYKPMKYEPMIDFPIPEPNPIMPKQQESCSSQETSKEHQNTSTTLYESVEDLRSSPIVNAQVQEEEEQTANPKQGRTVIEITFLRQRSTKTTTDGVPKQLPAKKCTNVLIS